MNRPDDYAVNPDTGDMFDPEGNLVGNLGDARDRKGRRTWPSGITIYLRGSKLDPAYITSVIGIEPTECWKKGEVVGRIRPIEKKNGLWSLDVPDGIISVDRAVAWFRENTSFSGNFTEIEGVDEADIDVLIFRKVKTAKYSMTIDPETSAWVAASGAEFSFTIYYDIE